MYFNDKLNLLISESNPKSFWDTLKTFMIKTTTIQKPTTRFPLINYNAI